MALAPPSGLMSNVCVALEVSRASLHRRRARLIAPPIRRARPTPARALSVPQRQMVLDLLHERASPTGLRPNSMLLPRDNQGENPRCQRKIGMSPLCKVRMSPLDQ